MLLCSLTHYDTNGIDIRRCVMIDGDRIGTYSSTTLSEGCSCHFTPILIHSGRMPRVLRLVRDNSYRP